MSAHELLLVQGLDPVAAQKVEVQLGHMFRAADGLQSLCFGFGTWS